MLLSAAVSHFGRSRVTVPAVCLLTGETRLDAEYDALPEPVRPLFQPIFNGAAFLVKTASFMNIGGFTCHPFHVFRGIRFRTPFGLEHCRVNSAFVQHGQSSMMDNRRSPERCYTIAWSVTIAWRSSAPKALLFMMIVRGCHSLLFGVQGLRATLTGLADGYIQRHPSQAPHTLRLLYLSHIDWRWIRQRPQQLVDSLSGLGHRVDVRYIPKVRRRGLSGGRIPGVRPLACVPRWRSRLANAFNDVSHPAKSHG